MATLFSRRIIAYVIDFFVLSAIMWIISYLLFILVQPINTYHIYKYFIYIVPILILLYFILSEKLFGASMGKATMYLQVKSRNGANISWMQAILRNLTKIYWVPIIFDWLLGKFFHTDRILNNITKTVVIDAD